ncbi:hypothetical protein HOY80DRAFT_1039265 [Tuber brumale]|nr:hypothetical protein HOY80DRAFT_1039265 [Tuber brumale]
MIDEAVEKALVEERRKVEERFGKLDAGFQKEEEKETPMPEEVSVEELGRVSLECLVSQAVAGGKKRMVGGEFDPEKGREKMLPMIVKEEPDCRKTNRSLSSTVLLRVLGEESMHDLCQHDIWVGGRWYSVKRFVAVPPRIKEEGFGRSFGAMEESVQEMKKEIGRLLKARNKAAKWIAYAEALKACDDEEGVDKEDDERFVRRMGIISEEEEALKRGKLWGEAAASLMARARGKRKADMGKANVLGKKLERKVNARRSASGKGKEKAVFVESDGNNSLLSESEAEARRIWLVGGGD